MERVIAWNRGGGSLHVSYTGEGSGIVTIWSDTANLSGVTRSLTITLTTTAGTNPVTRRITVSQLSRKYYTDGNTLVITEAMDEATADGSRLVLTDPVNTVSDNTWNLSE